MKHLKKRKRTFIISIIVFCLALIILTYFTNRGPTFLGRAAIAVTGPIQSAFTNTGYWFSEKFGYFRTIAELQEENRRLRDANAWYVMENSRLTYLEEAIENYAMLLDTQVRYANFPTMAAEVRGSEPHNFYNRFLIDRGSADGIMVDMPVLANGALVGRVVEVWRRTARVESIIDDRSGVSVRILRSGAVGTVRGDVELKMEGLVLLEFTSLDVDIAVGDIVHTSQISSLYPPGLLVGNVVEVRLDSRGMTTAIVKPAADFSPVKFVLVITELFSLDYGD
jgi:rod shape-determining protein MreC